MKRTHQLLAATDPLLIFTTLCKTETGDEATSWCVATTSADKENHRFYFFSTPSFDTPDTSVVVARWWQRINATPVLDVFQFVRLFSDTILDEHIPFIGEMSDPRAALSRQLAEMHNLNLKLEILRAGRDKNLAQENVNLEWETLMALRRCLPHRLAHMIVNFSGVSRHMADNADRAKNFALSVFELVEGLVDDGKFDSTLRSIIAFKSGHIFTLEEQRLYEPDIIKLVKRLNTILKIVCGVAEFLARTTRPIVVFFNEAKEVVMFNKFVHLLYPVDVLYDGSTGSYNESLVKQTPDHFYIAQCASVLPTETRPAITESPKKRRRNGSP